MTFFVNTFFFKSITVIWYIYIYIYIYIYKVFLTKDKFSLVSRG